MPGLGAIDWSPPWLAPWRGLGEPLATHTRRAGLVDALNSVLADSIALRAGRLRFVEHAELPDGEAYETFICRTACVPTRANLHDFFNGLAWLIHPELKGRLNELQAAQIELAAKGAPRGAVRDALTLFDENAALMQAPPVLVDALARRDWTAMFVTHRRAWAGTRIELFGHALVEKLLQPRKAITAHVWLVAQGAGPLSACVAETLQAYRLLLSPKPFLALPVLGVPGWWPANESADFYRDDSVFRPPKEKQQPAGRCSESPGARGAGAVLTSSER